MGRVKTAEEFWAYVVKAPGDSCWTWKDAKPGWRVLVRWKGRPHSPQLAYRVAYELENGPIPPGLYACHHCDNPSCVRPSHIFIGTAKDNTQDAARKGRLTGGVITVSDAQVAEAVRRYSSGGVTLTALAEEYGVSDSAVSKWVNGRCRTRAGA